ncbi:MAG: hypothetical protein JO258_03330 [Alphaproteobacteria bacterium]|nr:hypothetical protein [Alphaproteobacteria bacterium]
MRRPIRWAELGLTTVMLLGAIALGRGLVLLGAAVWICWTVFGVILAARVAHGWVTTQRPIPAGPVPAAARIPLDVVTLGALYGALAR